MQKFGELTYCAGLSIRSVGEGPRLVLIHGGSGSRTHWFRNVEFLSQHFRVDALDLPGFGESAAPPSDLPHAAYIGWVAQALQLFLNGEPYHFVGFSFGGAVTAALSAHMASLGRAPQRVTLVSPSGFGPPQGRKITLEKVRKTDNDSPEEIRAATARNLGRWMLAHTPEVDDPAIDLHLQNVARARFDSRAFSFRESLIKDLSCLDSPVQILLGEKDPLIFPSVAGRMALLRSTLPAALLTAIPDAGHWLQYEASDAVNRKIQQFHL